MKPLQPNRRSYLFDSRHLLPMVRDFAELTTAGLFRAGKRRHLIQTGRDIRQHAFNLRDPMPEIAHRDLAEYLGCSMPPDVILPPLGVVSQAGLGFAIPYTLLANIVSAIKPRRVLEIGTYRGVGTLTMALNAPDAEIYTVDLPDQSEESIKTLERADKEFARFARGTVGVAYEGHPSEARVHSIRADSRTMDASEFCSDIDFCLIDGGHSYECVRADTENALKVLCPGGVIVWDDYNWWSMDGVVKYLRQQLGRLDLRRIAENQYVVCRVGTDTNAPRETV